MTRGVYQRVRIGGGRRENITNLRLHRAGRGVRAEEVDPGDRRQAHPRRARRPREGHLQPARRRTEQKLVALIRQGVKELLATESAPPDSILFKNLALDWTSGRLAERFPDYVKMKSSAKDDEQKLRLYINPLIGPIPVVALKLEDAQRVMRQLPPSVSSATRRHVAQVMYRLLRLAVYPCKIVAHSPLPPGFLPKIDNSKAKQYLYPDEEAKLLRCKDIPIAYRIAYGVLAREGMRAGELVGNRKKNIPALTWAAFDLERGVVQLESEQDPRSARVGARPEHGPRPRPVEEAFAISAVRRHQPEPLRRPLP